MKKNFFQLLFLISIFLASDGLYSQTGIENFHEDHNEEPIPEKENYFEHYFDNEENEIQVNNHLKEGDNFQAKFLNMLFILSLLIGFMILASWLLKRMMKSRITQINQASYIKVLETRQLSSKSTLFLIEIEEEKVLVGESQNGLHLIATFPAYEIPTENFSDQN